MEKNNTAQYLKYAIGEIILVVIGILIALSINNWNENRKSIKITEHLLAKVHKELAFNINKSNNVFRHYRNKDSIVYKVLSKEVTFKDYKTNPRLSRILQGIPTADLKDNAYKSLINHEVMLTAQQDTIVNKLINLYEIDKIRVDLADELALNRLQKNSDKIRSENPWYYNFHVNNEYTDEMIDYFLNDPIYLNEITHYGRTNLGGHNGSTLNFRNNALESYKELSNYIEVKCDTTIIKDLRYYNHYLGTYVDSVETIELKKYKGNIIYIRKNRKGETEYKTVLYPETKTYFMVGNVFGKLLYNKKNEVTGLVRSLGSYRKESIKLN